MMYAALRIFGHGEIGTPISIVSVVNTGTAAEITHAATSAFADSEWSYVVVRDCDEIPDGRYPILSATSTVLRIAVIGASTGASGTGSVALDDCYVFCNAIPDGVGTATAARWFDCMAENGLSASIGAAIVPTGGIAKADGASMTLVYRQDAPVAALVRQTPTPVVTSDADVLRLRSSVVSVTSTSISVGLPDAADPASFTAPLLATIDGEAIGVQANPSTGTLTVTRGLLGTRATGHAVGAPLFAGMASAMGRDCTITLYRDPTSPTDIVTEFRAQIVNPRSANGITAIEISLATDLIVPVVPTSAENGLARCIYAGVIDGDHIAYIAQTDPASVWSWLRFGDVAVRIRRAASLDIEDGTDQTTLGYRLCAYQLPNGLSQYNVVPATPSISTDDGTRFIGVAGNFIRQQTFQIINGEIEQGAYQITGSRVRSNSQVAVDDSWWARPDGRWREDGAGLYDTAIPRPCHIFEPPGVHKARIADAIFLAVRSTLPDPAFGLTTDPVDILLQVLTSTGGTATGDGGQNGAYDLLPSEIGVGVPLTQIDTTGTLRAPFGPLDFTVIDPEDGAIADQISRQVLELCGLVVCQGATGGIVVTSTARVFDGGGVAITDDDLYCEGESPPAVTGPEPASDLLVSTIVANVVRVDLLEVFPVDLRTRRSTFTNGGNYTAGGGLYGRTQARPKVLTIAAVTNAEFPALDVISKTYGTLRQQITIPVIGPAESTECGAIVSLTLTQAPGADGTRGFDGLAIVIDRKYDLASGVISLSLLMFDDALTGVRAWAPGGDVSAVTSATEFVLETDTHLDPDDLNVVTFRAGDRVDVFDANYTLRSTAAPGIVDTWDEATGAMTLSTAATDGGGDVTPIVTDIVVLSAVSNQVTDAADLFTYMNSTTADGTRWQ